MKNKFRDVLFASTCLIMASAAGVQTGLAAGAPSVPVAANGIGGAEGLTFRAASLWGAGLP